ncbi:MAG: DsrE family protein [Bacteroidales bacterium]|nr:DsrE family protein [Bacteroidales bacterium]
MKKVMFLLLLVFTLSNLNMNAQNLPETQNKLAVLWTSGDIEVAEKVCFMYTHAAKRNEWFDEVTLIIWGPSAKLLTESPSLQKKVKQMQDDGVVVEACIACASLYGVDDDLKGFGIDVKGMGVPLSDYLKDEWKVLTF